MSDALQGDTAGRPDQSQSGALQGGFEKTNITKGPVGPVTILLQTNVSEAEWSKRENEKFD